MTNPRDVNIELVGHDHTGHATRSAERNLDKLERHMGRLRGTSDEVNKSFGGMGTSIASGINSVGLVALAALGLVFGPHIAAVIGASILAGGVGGVAALAAYLNRDNPQIKAALRHLTGNFTSIFGEEAGRLAPVMAAALEHVAAEVATWRVWMRQAFNAIGPMILPITKALTDFVTAFLPGFLTGLEASGPVIAVLAKDIPLIGYAIGQMFAIIGTNSDAIAIALDDVFTFLAGLIVLFGALIATGAIWAAGMHKLIAGIGAGFRWLGGAINSAWNATQSVLLQGIVAVGREIAGFLRMLASAVSKIPGIGDATARGLRAAAASVDASVADMQASINALKGKTVTVTVDAALSARARSLKSRGVNVPFASGVSFEATAPGQNARTQPPAEVNVSNETRVLLDGAPFYTLVQNEVKQSESRQAWRARTGRR